MHETRKKVSIGSHDMEVNKSKSAQELKAFVGIDDIVSMKSEESPLVLEQNLNPLFQNNMNALFEDPSRINEKIFGSPDNSFYKKDATLDLCYKEELSILEEENSNYSCNKSFFHETLKDLVSMTVEKKTAFLGVNEVMKFFGPKNQSQTDEKKKTHRIRKSLDSTPKIVLTPNIPPHFYADG